MALIEIMNSNFMIVDILRQYTYASYTQPLQGLGKFQLNVPVCDETLYILDRKEQRYVLFDKLDLGVIEDASRSTDSEFSDTVQISGRMANVILTRRVIDRTINVKSGVLDYFNKLLSMFYDEEEVKYKEQALSYSVSVDRETQANKFKVEKQVTGGYVWDEVLEFLEKYNMGCVVRPHLVETRPMFDTTTGELFSTNVQEWNFRLIVGKDRTRDNKDGNIPVILSQTLSNISNASYKRNTTDLKNVAIVAGEGEGTDRKYLRTTINNDVPECGKGFALSELWIDARDLQKETKDENGNDVVLTDEEYINVLQKRAQEKAEENTVNESYESTLTKRSDLYKYGVDYSLGDIVTVEDNELGVNVDAQIISYTKSYQNGVVEQDIGFSYGKIVRSPIAKINSTITQTQGQQVTIGYLENETEKAQNTTKRLDALLTTPATKAYGTAEDCYKIKKIVAGSIVRKGTGSSSIPVFTQAQALAMFGLPSGTDTSGGQIQFVFMNGDGGASNVHYDGCTYMNSTYYAVGHSSWSTGNCRINYIGIYAE